MKRTTVVLSASLAFSASTLPVSAQPPSWEFFGIIPRPVLWCQDSNDLRILVDTRVKDLEGSVAMFDEFAKENLHGYARCSYDFILGAVQAGENIEYGVVPADNNEGYLKAWMVRVGNSNMDVWIFYTEPIPDKGA